MTKRVYIPFAEAEPSSGPQTDHIPPGTYRFKIADAELSETSKEPKRPMATFRYIVVHGPHAGSRLRDNFVFPRKGEAEDSKVGAARFHSLLIACGGKRQEKNMEFDIDTMRGREFTATVQDDTYVSDKTGKEYETSKIQFYLPHDRADEALQAFETKQAAEKAEQQMASPVVTKPVAQITGPSLAIEEIETEDIPSADIFS